MKTSHCFSSCPKNGSKKGEWEENRGWGSGRGEGRGGEKRGHLLGLCVGLGMPWTVVPSMSWASASGHAGVSHTYTEVMELSAPQKPSRDSRGPGWPKGVLQLRDTLTQSSGPLA